MADLFTRKRKNESCKWHEWQARLLNRTLDLGHLEEAFLCRREVLTRALSQALACGVSANCVFAVEYLRDRALSIGGELMQESDFDMEHLVQHLAVVQALYDQVISFDNSAWVADLEAMATEDTGVERVGERAGLFRQDLRSFKDNMERWALGPLVTVAEKLRPGQTGAGGKEPDTRVITLTSEDRDLMRKELRKSGAWLIGQGSRWLNSLCRATYLLTETLHHCWRSDRQESRSDPDCTPAACLVAAMPGSIE